MLSRPHLCWILTAFVDDSDILMSATTFLDSVSMPADLAQICRAVFRSTLRSSPPDRLPDGWNSVKSFFGAVL